MITETGHATGAIVSPKDNRDYEYGVLGSASIPFDWDKGFDIEQKVGIMPVKDQGQTSACGGFAWASLFYVIDEKNREEMSEKFIYAHTHVGNGGSAGRTNCELCRTKGVSSKALCPLPSPLTEQAITFLGDIKEEAFKYALDNKIKYYARVNSNIEEVAHAIRDNGGVVLGIHGQNNGTWRTKFPLPPTSSDVWAHWVYAGKAKLINGKKYIGFLNSWGNEIGEKGWQYIGEEYFNAKWGFFENWTMTYDPQIVPPVTMPTLKMGSKGEPVKILQRALGIKDDGIFGKITYKILMVFQKEHNLIVDGICGKATWAIIINK